MTKFKDYNGLLTVSQLLNMLNVVERTTTATGGAGHVWRLIEKTVWI